MLFLVFLLAFPSTFGSKGIYRAKSGDVEWLSEARSILTISADAEGYRYDYDDTLFDYGSGRVTIGYTPFNRFEAYTMWRGHGEGTIRQPISDSDFSGDLGDLDIGAKFVIRKFNNSYLSSDLAVTLPIGNDPYTNDGVIVYPKLIGTFDFGDYWRLFPIRLHVNAGFPIGRDGSSDHFPVTFATAFELPSKLFTYFIELSRMHERDWNWRFSPGLKIHPWHTVCLTIAADLGATEDYRIFGANAGLAVNSVLIRERETRPTGDIAGEIRDRATNMPVQANVSLLEIDESAIASEKYGVYKLIGVPRGIYTIFVQSPGYTSESRVVVIDRNKTNVVNFQLTRAMVTYTGIVMNALNEQPISSAAIRFEGETITTSLTESDGTFEQKLKPGVYELKVNKKEFAQYVSTYSLFDDHADTIWLKPVAAVAETPEAIVYFNIDDANIRDDQKTTLDEIAEFLKTHPSVNCELRGHTDTSGDIDYNEILSLARANSVKDYLVKVHGIEKQRIATLAFSKTKLVKQSPEKSRRVEIFLIK
jgi:outer membrane protein OmpA-like peptidoglycan-associated protein